MADGRMRSVPASTLDVSQDGQGSPSDSGIEDSPERRHRNNAATGASAAGARAAFLQAMSFYFRAPAKAFFRTRVEYVSMASFLVGILSLTCSIVTWYLDRAPFGNPQMATNSK